MKKYLLALTVTLSLFCFFAFVSLANAQTPTPGEGGITEQSFTPTGAQAPPGSTTTTATEVTIPDNTWVPDADVTFAGKSAVRAKNFLDWSLTSYQWSNTDTSLSQYWASVRNVIYALLLLVVFGAAVMMIVSHGTNLTVWEFIRRFILIVIVITFSYAFIRLTYQMTDIVQGFFTKNPSGNLISSTDLLNLSFAYKDFQGYRLSGAQNDEAAFIAINLTKLTAITYYVMACLLLVRKIILWFFIVVSPVFPLLILYIPFRNTAKIWIGEFFRWLLYGPLFFIFLSGLITLWQNKINILNFPTTPTSYPTAINILLGGPGQKVSATNSLNTDASFIQYVVALIMLWAVIFLPFLLLRIFLDYIAKISVDEDRFSYIKNSLNRLSLGPGMFGGNVPIFGKAPTPRETTRTRTEETVVKETSSAGTRGIGGISTRSDLFGGRVSTNIPNITSTPSESGGTTSTPKVNVRVSPIVEPVERESTQIKRTFSVPTSERTGIGEITEAIRHGIEGAGAAPTAPLESAYRPMTVKAEVTTTGGEKAENEPYSKPVSKAGNVKIPTQAELAEQKKAEQKQTEVTEEAGVSKKGHPRDYAEIKETWIKNFREANPIPPQTKKDWIESEKNQADDLIRLLMSGKNVDLELAKEKISHTIPFLMLGGFSKTHAVGYLEAKIEAAEQVLHEISSKAEHPDNK